MIIRDLFFESGSTEATKIKKILQNTSKKNPGPCVHTCNLLIKFLQATNLTWSDSTAASVFQNCPLYTVIILVQDKNTHR
jgi:hypothetical protein